MLRDAGPPRRSDPRAQRRPARRVRADRGAAGAPTVLLYAHHDVQPAADAGPVGHAAVRARRAGRADVRPRHRRRQVRHRDPRRGDPGAPGRGRASGARSRSSWRARRSAPPSTCPSSSVGNADLLRADVAVVADGGNVRTGAPTIGTSIRGATSITVRVDVLPIAVHSGSFGGPLPDAVMALSRMLASLHDDDGELTVDGSARVHLAGDATSPRRSSARRRACYPEVRLLGSGLDRGPDAVEAVDQRPRVRGAAPRRGREPDRADRHGRRSGCGWPRARTTVRRPRGSPSICATRRRGACAPRVTVEDEPGKGYLVDTSSPVLRAPRATALRDAFDARCRSRSAPAARSRSCPMLAETFPGIQVLIWGAADHLSNYHSRDESVDLGEVVRMAQAEAAVPAALGRRARDAHRC